MPETVRLTEEAQEYYEEIQDSYDVEVLASKIVQASLKLMDKKRNGENE